MAITIVERTSNNPLVSSRVNVLRSASQQNSSTQTKNSFTQKKRKLKKFRRVFVYTETKFIKKNFRIRWYDILIGIVRGFFRQSNLVGKKWKWDLIQNFFDSLRVVVEQTLNKNLEMCCNSVFLNRQKSQYSSSHF